MPDLLLIPSIHSIPAVCEALERPWEQRELSAIEVRELSALLVRYVWVGDLLVRYAQALGGRPSRN